MKYLVISFILVLLPVSQVGSLSVIYCEQDTVECKRQNCLTENVVIEWDNEVLGEHKPLKDCGNQQSDERAEQVIYGIATLVLIATAFYYTKNSNKTR